MVSIIVNRVLVIIKLFALSFKTIKQSNKIIICLFLFPTFSPDLKLTVLFFQNGSYLSIKEITYFYRWLKTKCHLGRAQKGRSWWWDPPLSLAHPACPCGSDVLSFHCLLVEECSYFFLSYRKRKFLRLLFFFFLFVATDCLPGKAVSAFSWLALLIPRTDGVAITAFQEQTMGSPLPWLLG